MNMKRSEFVLGALSVAFVGCTKDGIAEDVKNTKEKIEMKKPLVVYFSATGTTAEIAKMIAEEADSDIFEIIPKEPYSSDDLNYNGDCRANREQNDDSARPEIENDLSAVEDYDVIYLGYPIWWGTNPKIIQTFCEGYDISDAEIYTFCTSGSSGIDISISNLKDNYSLNINCREKFYYRFKLLHGLYRLNSCCICKSKKVF